MQGKAEHGYSCDIRKVRGIWDKSQDSETDPPFGKIQSGFGVSFLAIGERVCLLIQEALQVLGTWPDFRRRYVVSHGTQKHVKPQYIA